MFFKYLIVFFISMVPLIELRGAIPVAIGMGLDTLPSIAVCAVGNLLPVPIIYFFARKFLIWGLDKPYISGICHFFHDKGEAAGQKLSSSRFGRFGLVAPLIVFVGRHRCLDRNLRSQLSGPGHEENRPVRHIGGSDRRHHYGHRQQRRVPRHRYVIT